MIKNLLILSFSFLLLTGCASKEKERIAVTNPQVFLCSWLRDNIVVAKPEDTLATKKASVNQTRQYNKKCKQQ